MNIVHLELKIVFYFFFPDCWVSLAVLFQWKERAGRESGSDFHADFSYCYTFTIAVTFKRSFIVLNY